MVGAAFLLVWLAGVEGNRLGDPVGYLGTLCMRETTFARQTD